MTKAPHLHCINLFITKRCNLRCRHCAVFAPYYQKPRELSAELAAKLLETFFQMVDSVDIFTINGGEPLTHSELPRILKTIFTWSDKVLKRFDFLSNGSLDIPDDVLSIMAAQGQKLRIIIDDYGQLSPKVPRLIKILTESGIPFKVNTFHTDNPLYGGWVDFTDHRFRQRSQQEQEQLTKGCLAYTRSWFGIAENGEICRCQRSFWRNNLGLYPKPADELLNLLDENLSIEEKREKLLHVIALPTLTSCAYCDGHTNSRQRHQPAEQLPPKQPGALGDLSRGKKS